MAWTEVAERVIADALPPRPGSATVIEEPSFRAPEHENAFELREYAPYLVAETCVEANFTDAGNTAFQRLFRYISGNNVSQQKIAVTAPTPLDKTIEIRTVPAHLVASWHCTRPRDQRRTDSRPLQPIVYAALPSPQRDPHRRRAQQVSLMQVCAESRARDAVQQRGGWTSCRSQC